uniref:Uncharacterized protein n=1 Tax=Physcomitrium patens TaxID=3218 RepID=A0A2K1LAB6_PHYPA|nr:hypothetical protein PHYPA_001394 [Physcomitrium patens]PNR62970.1 hypothetical protein PHYPA_001395 [Physcomitrium patens]
MRVPLALCLVVGCIIVGISAQRSPDGLPRPENTRFSPDYPFGPTPTVYNNVTGAVIDCDWYGWENILYPTSSVRCTYLLRAFLTNATLFPPSKREAYVYYYHSKLSDPATEEPYCYQGCFKLSASSSSPPSAPASDPPPPPDIIPPSPTTFNSPPPPTPILTPTTPSVTPSTSPGTPTTPTTTPRFNSNSGDCLRPSAPGSWIAMVAGAAMLMMRGRW